MPSTISGTIVVGVDGSGTAKKAAERARDLAVALGATLHVVSAFDSDRTGIFGAGSDQVVVSTANSVAHNAPCDVYIANTYGAE